MATNLLDFLSGKTRKAKEELAPKVSSGVSAIYNFFTTPRKTYSKAETQAKIDKALEKIPELAKTLIPALRLVKPASEVLLTDEGFMSDKFLNASEKIRTKGYHSLADDEKKAYVLTLSDIVFGATSAPQRAGIQNLVKTAVNQAKTQDDAIRRVGVIVNQAVESKGPDVLQKLKTLRASLSRSMFDISGASGAGNYKFNYGLFQRARQNPEVTKLIDHLEAQVIRLDDVVKNLAPKTIDRTQLQGRALSIPTERLLHPETIVSEKLEPLAQEARKYANVEEFKVFLNKQKGMVTDRTFLEREGVTIEKFYDQAKKEGFGSKVGDIIKSARGAERPIPVEEFERQMERINIPPSKKVNILDYLRTPENVLKKIGLVNEGKVLRRAAENYKTMLRTEQQRIASWAKSVPERGSSKRIFQYLDGKLEAKSLPEKELAVANEIKGYLAKWADKLGLPEDKRVSDYITHIFEKGEIKLEFDPELAKIIESQVPGSVYNPFLQKRAGAPEYVQDAWRALDAYVKRGTRDVNMTPALKVLKESANDLDLASWKYIKSYADRINLRPTDVDELLDNLIKSTPVGYKFTQRPTAYLTRKFRNTIYRGALGLNIGSAAKNLTQGVNTYAKLGEKHTALGYFDLAKNMVTNNLDELYRYGILDDNIIQDREIYAVKKGLQKIDEGLWFFFDTAEKINRGAAFWGAKRQALSKGLSEPEAIEFGKKIVRDTQFVFGAIDTPVALSSDLVKVFTQFLSYPIKQTEFLVGMAKDKNFLGLLRYTMASVALTATIGKIFGLDLKNFLPFSEGRFTSPAGEAFTSATKLLSSNEETREEGGRALSKLLPLLIPAGVQAKKTLQGAVSQERGYTATPTGRVRYPVSQDPFSTIQSLLFGQYASSEAREYYGKDRSPLGEKQSELFKLLGLPYYKRVMQERESK